MLPAGFATKSIAILAAISEVAVSLLFLPAAAAQDYSDKTSRPASQSPIDIEVTIDMVSDYRFRGVSLNDKNIALQPSLTVIHESGLYVGAWGSNIAENAGDDIEVDLFVGFSFGSDVTYDVGAIYYIYPGVSDSDYVEATGKIGTTLGPVTFGATLAYAPEQNGNNDTIYVAGDFEVPIGRSPFSVAGMAGFEDGTFDDNKLDWSLGINANLNEHVTASIAYVDTNRQLVGLGQATLLAQIGLVF